MQYAHRVAYQDAHGPIPPGMVVMHVCDNPPCVNPAHLSLGTIGDNNRDMWRKRRGRLSHYSGERNPAHRLTAEQVAAIRADPRTGVAVAREYGVHFSTVYRIRGQETWR